MGFVEQVDVVEVPKGSGLKGLLKTVEGILTEIPRVKELHISSTGQVRYTWHIPEDAKPQALDIQFNDLMPYAIIRNTNLVEVLAPEGSGVLESVSHLLNAVYKDRLQPVCFVVHPQSPLRASLQKRGIDMGQDELFGYQVLEADELPQSALILCASYGRTIQIADTYKAYMIVIGD